MKKKIMILALTLILPGSDAAGGMLDDPLLAMLVVDQLEIQIGDGDDPLAWDVEGWIGYDLHKLWIKTDGDYEDSRTEDMEAQILYSRARALSRRYQADSSPVSLQHFGT